MALLTHKGLLAIAAVIDVALHSRGGPVISEAGERAPEAMLGLVYLTAVLLQDGMAASDSFATVSVYHRSVEPTRLRNRYPAKRRAHLIN